MRDDVGLASSVSGVPTAVNRPMQVPVKSSKRIRLPNGVEVNELRYTSFTDELQRFGETVAAVHPAQVPRHVANLATRLLEWHNQELIDFAGEVGRHFDKPHAARWESYRAASRARVIGTRGIDVAKSRAALERVLGGGSAELAAFRRMAEATGCGDMVEMHQFLNRVHDMAGASPARTLYGGSTAQKPPTSAKPRTGKADLASYSGKPSPAAASRPVKAVSASKRLYGS